MGFGCRVYIFSCDINRLIFSKRDKWPLQWSASSFEPSEEEGKKKPQPSIAVSENLG